MTDNETTYQSGERLSFFKLFNEKKYKVQIPIIQRDYAQGRTTTQEVRNNFLDALYDYLDANIPNRDLDFVYGSLVNENGVNVFVPLDGQQRLTTLFLLHWYLCQITDNNELKDKFKSAITNGKESLFTYETRSSSREFCNALVKSEIDFNNLLETDYEDEDKKIPLENELSKTIQNESWFFLSWKYDPTIQAMLVMLDTINKKFNGKKEFFDRLLDEEQPIVTFLFLNLKDFQLTDDLYIKMNSRGKPLSGFENFKAQFSKCLDNVDVANRKFYIDYDGVSKEVSLKEYFSFNIDTKWADTFWNYRNLQSRENRTRETDNNFDDEFVNFIRTIFTFKYAVCNSEDDNLKYLLGTQDAKKRKDYLEVISYHKYRDLNVIFDEEKETKMRKDGANESVISNLKNSFSNSALFLIDALDALSVENKLIKKYISGNYSAYYKEEDTFRNALKLNLVSNPERLKFFAYLVFLVKNKKDKTGIDQWMRVIHNLTHPDNVPIDEVKDFVRTIKAIDEMSSNSNKIIEYLANNYAISGLDSEQLKEERVKAMLILKSEKWLEKIISTEKHGYFNGQIMFILYFSEIMDYYSLHGNINWDTDTDSKMYDRFCNYSDKSKKAFDYNYENRIHDEKFCFERAVLTKGDYFIGGKWERRGMLSTKHVKNNIKRTYSWKNLLTTINRNYVKQVFDDARFDTNNIEKSLENICKDKTGDWRDMFIECPGLIEYSNQGFVGFDYKNRFTIYKESQLNHYHVQTEVLYFWYKFMEPKLSFFDSKFEKVDWFHTTSAEEETFIELNRSNNWNITIRIYFTNNWFQIAVMKNGGQSYESNFSETFKTKLNELSGYEWTFDFYGLKCFWKSCKTTNETIEQLKLLCDIL